MQYILCFAAVANTPELSPGMSPTFPGQQPFAPPFGPPPFAPPQFSPPPSGPPPFDQPPS